MSQITLKSRETLNGAISINTNPVDMSEYGAYTAQLLVAGMTGTGPLLTVQMQTSNDLENWASSGSSFALSAAGNTMVVFDVKTDKYQRYIRASITLSGTNPIASYSLWLNTFPSS